jgi:hypothetical protein
MEAQRNDYPFLALKSRSIRRELRAQNLAKPQFRRFEPWGYMIRQLGVKLR